MEDRISPIQRQGDLKNTFTHDNIEKQILILNDTHPSINNQAKRNTFITYRTKYPTFLPDDFNPDETEGLTEQPTGLLSNDVMKNVKAIANKLSVNQSSLVVELNEDERTFIR
jgi:hypothetical protein